MASGSNDKLVRVMRFDSDSCTANGPVVNLRHHRGTVRDVVFCSGHLLASAGADGCLYLTDVNREQVVDQLAAGSSLSQVSSVSLHPHRQLLWSASSDHTLSLWDMRQQRLVCTLQMPLSIHSGSRLQGSAVSAAGELVLVGCEGGCCLAMESRSQRWLQQFRPHTQDCRSVHLSLRRSALLSASFDGSIAMTCLNSALPDSYEFQRSVVVAEHSKKVIQARWHPNADIFASTSTDHTACLWKLDTDCDR